MVVTLCQIIKLDDNAISSCYKKDTVNEISSKITFTFITFVVQELKQIRPFKGKQ